MTKMENKSFSERFFESVKNKEVAVYLASGIKLTGILLDYNNEHILLEGFDQKIEGQPQLVYNAAISTIIPRNKK